MTPRRALAPALFVALSLLAGCAAPPAVKPLEPVETTPAAPVEPQPAPAPEPEPEPAPEATPPAPVEPEAVKPPVVVCEPPPRPAPAEKPLPPTALAILVEAERVLLYPPGLVVAARLDTGAPGSVLDALNVREFERDGKTWVKFLLRSAPDAQPQEISRPLLRSSTLKSGARRYVVSLRVRLGSIDQYVDFTLGDRGPQAYPMVLGRNFLRDQAVVDVSRRFTVQTKP
ncbi:MAG: ATP-dependent zinc protease [Gammaproteobacteria bacterium]